MIIFGWRTCESTTGSGTFQCPHCRTLQFYRHVTYRRWFTLYFLPVIPLGRVGEQLECQGCQCCFSPRVLEPTSPNGPFEPSGPRARERGAVRETSGPRAPNAGPEAPETMARDAERESARGEDDPAEAGGTRSDFFPGHRQPGLRPALAPAAVRLQLVAAHVADGSDHRAFGVGRDPARRRPSRRQRTGGDRAGFRLSVAGRFGRRTDPRFLSGSAGLGRSQTKTPSVFEQRHGALVAAGRRSGGESPKRFVHRTSANLRSSILPSDRPMLRDRTRRDLAQRSNRRSLRG
jgi:hypothetical protein